MLTVLFFTFCAYTSILLDPFTLTVSTGIHPVSETAEDRMGWKILQLTFYRFYKRVPASQKGTAN